MVTPVALVVAAWSADDQHAGFLAALLPCTQTQLCDFWWFEHLLVVPGVDEDVINFFGGLFPMREAENCSLPAQVSARLFLRHIKEYISQFLEEPEEQDTGENGRHRREDLLQALGLLHRLSLKQQQFRRPEAAVAVRPPVELVTEVSVPNNRRHSSGADLEVAACQPNPHCNG